VNITGDAGVCYMMGNFEACARYGIGITTLHINTAATRVRAGRLGSGHDPYTWKVSDHSSLMSAMARAVGCTART